MARSMGTYNTITATAINAGTAQAAYADQGSRMSAVLRAVLARTGDTGQVNWAAVTTLPTTTVPRDYEVFAFTDALQATKPIFIRVDWGLYSASQAAGQVWVGTATNGAGVLSGLQLGQPTAGTGAISLGGGAAVKSFNQSASATVSVPRYCYASSDGSYLSFFCNIQQPGQAGTTSDSLGGFVIERTRDADGTPNGNGFTVWNWLASADSLTAAASSFQGTQVRAYDLSQPNSYAPATTFDYAAALPGSISTATTTMTGAGPAQAFPVYGAVPQPQGASKALALAYVADLPRMTQVTLTHYGQATQWISCGAAQPVYAPYMSSTTATAARNILSLVFRWE